METERDINGKDEITLIIVYGVNKSLSGVKDDQAIGTVKLAAMALFGIPSMDSSQYQLHAKVRGIELPLEDSKDVENYELHSEQKVTLSASTPFGEV